MRRAPNIVCIVADDLGWRDLACTGSPFYETPQIDRLAASATRFDRAYAPAPNCSPSRASLLTGRAPARIGLTQIVGGHSVGRLKDVPSFGMLPRQELTYARALRRGGYRTWHVGKWHLGPAHSWPEHHGFDVNIGGCDAGRPRSWTSPYRLPTLPDGPAGEHLTDRLTDEAIELMRGAVADRAAGRDDRPFLLNLWHYAVHTPLSDAPPAFVEHFAQKARRLGLGHEDQVEVAGPYPYWRADPTPMRRRRVQGEPVYAAMVAHLDESVGRVLDELARLGLADETVVIFTSDNGGLHTGAASTANLPLADGKGWLSEGGVRIPLLVRAPGTSLPGTVVGAPVTLTDLYPSILELAGVAARSEEPTDGHSLVALLGGDAGDGDRALHWHFPHYTYTGATPTSAVLSGRWKLVRSYEERVDRLYDLELDPGETQDVAAQNPDVVHRLAADLTGWIDEVGGLVPERNPIAPFDEFDHGLPSLATW